MARDPRWGGARGSSCVDINHVAPSYNMYFKLTAGLFLTAGRYTVINFLLPYLLLSKKIITFSIFLPACICEYIFLERISTKRLDFTFRMPFSCKRTLWWALFVALAAALPDHILPDGWRDLKVLSLAWSDCPLGELRSSLYGGLSLSCVDLEFLKYLPEPPWTLLDLQMPNFIITYWNFLWKIKFSVLIC